MTQAMTGYDRYQADFQTFEETLPVKRPTWLGDIRKQGVDSFTRIGFPTATRGNEKWKYTNVNPIAKATFAYPFEAATDGVNARLISEMAPWHESWPRLVFFDGFFSESFSTVGRASNSLRIANLADAVTGDGELLEAHLGHLAIVEDDGFTAVNTAFLRDGAFVHVPEDSSPESAIHLVFIATERPEPTASYPRTLIVAGRHSKLTVVESYIGISQGSYFTNAVTEMVAEEGAQIEHYKYLMESPDAFHMGTTRVKLGRDCTFNSTSFARGARLARNDLMVLLDAPGGSCFLNGLYFTSGSEHLDNHINIDHAVPNTSSDLYFKGILNDTSRAVFSGRVLIRKDAQKTYARQADKNLILSKGARVNTKPSLEIFADDVQATHGATAGAVAQDALFYMKSRGLDEETARSILIYGFAHEIIDAVRLDPLRDQLDRLLSGTIPEFRAEAA